MSDKLKLLFLSASPANDDPVRSGAEIREIHQQIALSLDRKRFEVRAYFAVRTSDLTRILLDHPPNILHFSGHGDEQGGICLENDLGEPMPVSGEMLAGLFAGFKGTLRIVFLNACETRAMAEAFRPLAEYTIVMNRRVSGRTALVFAMAFYQAFARRQSVRDSFDLAVKQLRIDQLDDDAPELFEGVTPLEIKPAVPPIRKRERTNPGSGISTNITGSTVSGVTIIQGNNNMKG
jgi:hypothetical protein